MNDKIKVTQSMQDMIDAANKMHKTYESWIVSGNIPHKLKPLVEKHWEFEPKLPAPKAMNFEERFNKIEAHLELLCKGVITVSEAIMAFKQIQETTLRCLAPDGFTKELSELKSENTLLKSRIRDLECKLEKSE
ncbi:hypothetical protein [Campylobacter sp. RM16190]|uniref:hypothetical protein n=1 Tax=Campylobacter sp. RM16190 TaxID=1705727 RepID=UPI001474DD56|nr:hypothetical protein [Campylobacter sp. RM16190]